MPSTTDIIRLLCDLLDGPLCKGTGQTIFKDWIDGDGSNRLGQPCQHCVRFTPLQESQPCIPHAIALCDKAIKALEEKASAWGVEVGKVGCGGSPPRAALYDVAVLVDEGRTGENTGFHFSHALACLRRYRELLAAGES